MSLNYIGYLFEYIYIALYETMMVFLVILINYDL